jgi:hypothetical protein
VLPSAADRAAGAAVVAAELDRPRAVDPAPAGVCRKRVARVEAATIDRLGRRPVAVRLHRRARGQRSAEREDDADLDAALAGEQERRVAPGRRGAVRARRGLQCRG